MLYLFCLYVHSMLLLLLLNQPFKDVHSIVMEGCSMLIYGFSTLVFWRDNEFIMFLVTVGPVQDEIAPSEEE